MSREQHSLICTKPSPLTAEWALRALVDFTLSNARRFYSSMGNALDGKGLERFSEGRCQCNHDKHILLQCWFGAQLRFKVKFTQRNLFRAEIIYCCLFVKLWIENERENHSSKKCQSVFYLLLSGQICNFLLAHWPKKGCHTEMNLQILTLVKKILQCA